MGLNGTQAGERVHIAFFGRRNAGKSSLVNAVASQEVAVVSDVKGTTTDPVRKTMELLPLGPVMLVDTPGLDDVGDLGIKRMARSRQVVREADIAVLVLDSQEGPQDEDLTLLKQFYDQGQTCLVALNKVDLLKEGEEKVQKGPRPLGEWAKEAGWDLGENPAFSTYPALYLSALKGFGIEAFKEVLGRIKPDQGVKRGLLDGVLRPGDLALLVIPLDKAAPKGRIILPQQQTIRAGLDKACDLVVANHDRLKEVLARLKNPPDLVITDSQVVLQVAQDLPDSIPMTSFSILFARYKGSLAWSLDGIKKLRDLPPGGRVLMAEACTHHRQCGDIGTEKIPKLLESYLDRDFTIETSSGRDFPEDLSPYDLVIHCGGCMLNAKDMEGRVEMARKQGVAITNYGLVLAESQGVLDRVLQPLQIPGF